MAEPRKTVGVVEQVATSMLLQAINRLGVPLLMAGVTWMVVQAVALDRRVSLMERELDTHLSRVVRLEGFREADMERSSQRQQAITDVLATLRNDLAGIRADQSAMLRALTRLESITDRNTAPTMNGGSR